MNTEQKEPTDFLEERFQDLSKEDLLKIMFSILDVMDEPIQLTTNDCRTGYMNPSFYNAYISEQVTNLETLIGQNVLDQDPESYKLLKATIDSGMPMYQYYSTGSAGTHHRIVDILPIYLKGKVLGAITINRNVSQIREMNQQLKYYKRLYSDLTDQIVRKEPFPPAFSQIIGHSFAFQQALQQAAIAAPTMSSVCLLGESGTGKEEFAKAIHQSSKRASGPFVAVNCSAIPENLIESELFGYVGGAFTGANPKGYQGKFQLANGGTIFLDEIGDMPLHTQAKVLRVLQEREVIPVGGSKPIPLNFRLISATNRDLKELIKEKKFREDLYYRICVLPVNIPPLRERLGDPVILAKHFLEEACSELNVERYFSEEALEAIAAYSWPGNVRELKNCVERAAVFSVTEEIDTDTLPISVTHNKQLKPARPNTNDFALRPRLETLEAEIIRAALEHTSGNKSEAIELLGLSRRNFYLKLEKYHIGK